MNGTGSHNVSGEKFQNFALKFELLCTVLFVQCLHFIFVNKGQNFNLNFMRESNFRANECGES